MDQKLGGKSMEGEIISSPKLELPQNVSISLYDKFKEFLDEDLEQIKSYFNELLTYKRAVISLEIAAPISVLYEIEKYLNENQYLTYNQINFVTKGDENKEFFPQELFDKYPDKIMGSTILFISYRNEFIHLAELVENVPLSCDIHEDCDPRAALRGLIYGYHINNIIGFIQQNSQ